MAKAARCNRRSWLWQSNTYQTGKKQELILIFMLVQYDFNRFYQIRNNPDLFGGTGP